MATVPAKRAREIRVAWERFVTGDPVRGGEDEGIRVPIADSWRRSAAAGVDPSGAHVAPVVAGVDETTALGDPPPRGPSRR